MERFTRDYVENVGSLVTTSAHDVAAELTTGLLMENHDGSTKRVAHTQTTLPPIYPYAVGAMLAWTVTYRRSARMDPSLSGIRMEDVDPATAQPCAATRSASVMRNRIRLHRSSVLDCTYNTNTNREESTMATTTIDNLIDPRKRDITTVWTTDLRVNEGTMDAGVVRVALETTHDKDSKQYRSRLHREVLTDSGVVTYRFVLYGPRSADQGLTLATEPTPRFNARRAAAFHELVLTNLDGLLADEGRHPDVARELADLLAAAKAVA